MHARGDPILLETPIRWVKKSRNPRTLLQDVKFEVVKVYYWMFRPRSTSITDMSWDTLIVLDGCRFDVFAKYNNIPGKLVKTISVASCTWNWAAKNFRDKQMKDVVYISANPFISYFYLHKTIGHIPFYKIVEVWKDGWNDELKTVHPSIVNLATLKSLALHPKKRHIIHYMQPHHPFIGSLRIIDTDAVPLRDEFIGREGLRNKKLDAFKMARKGLLDIETIWRAYIFNLKLALRYVKKLLPALDGKVCITSDHGNAFGTYGVFYGHPENAFLPGLIEVPWLEYNADSKEAH